MTQRTLTCAMIAAAFSATSAVAATAIVDGVGGALTMNSGGVSDVLGADSGEMTDMDLTTLHGAIEDDLGVGATDGKVTLMLVDSEDAGLSFVALVDSQMGMERGDIRGTELASLELNTDGPTSATDFVNDAESDVQQSAVIGDRLTRGGMFNWNPNGEGDGFAWGNLDLGDFLGFSFSETDSTFAGLMDSMTFQFLDFEGGEWVVDATREFSAEEQFAFSVTIIPTPMAASMGGLGLIGVLGVRRRRV